MYKNNEDENLNQVFNKYDSNFNKNNCQFEKVYKHIKDIYNSKLDNKDDFKDKQHFIKFERYRLENNKCDINASTNGMLVSLIVALATICIEVILKIFEITNRVTLTSIIMIFKITYFIVFIIILVILTRFFNQISKCTKKLKIYDLAIKALNDIEEEIKNKKIKNEHKYFRIF